MNHTIRFLATLLLATLWSGANAADAYPSQPIKIIIPFPAGGAVDTLIRTIGPELSADLGQPIVVDNRPGGGAQIAAAALMGAPADGYTVFAGEVGAFAINPSLYKNIRYQPVRDFDGISMLVRTPMVMYGSPSGKLNSLTALKAVLANGQPINYGSFGAGTAPHILGHLLSRAAPAANFTHIPYKGAPSAILAMMANEIDMLFDGVPGTLNMMRDNKAVPLAVAAVQRSEHLPQVPTTAEIGYPAMAMDLWIGVAAKKGTPAPVIARLHAAFEKAMSKPELWKKFAEFGYSRKSMTSAQFNAFIQSEIDRYRPVILDTGVTLD